MTQNAYIENGIIKDLGPHVVTVSALAEHGPGRPDPALMAYPDGMVVEVHDAVQIGWTWDGTKATPPDPMAGITTLPALDPVEKLRAFLAGHPDVAAHIAG